MDRRWSETMQTHSHPEPDAWVFFKRALCLRCPECGISPIFVPIRKLRRLSDWLNPLDGCPRCGYAYVRENGYFLLSIWGFNYGVVGMLGIIGIFVVADYFHLNNWQMFIYLVPPLPILNFLFIRHSKAFFLAMDHFFDPHVKSQ
jgi:uncharacterized protein (DUF983 family)